jgi:hypothetical protein
VKRFAVVLALVLVNLPAVHDALTQREINRQGREVTAVVLDAGRIGGTGFVDYRLPRSVDARGTRYSARLGDAAFARARATHRLEVRVVPGKPGANRPDGALPDRLFWWVALVADAVFVLVLALWLAGRRRRETGPDDAVDEDARVD